MKLARFQADGQVAVGIVEGKEVVACETATLDLPPSIPAILRCDPSLQERLQQASTKAGKRYALEDVTLLAPVPKPEKFLCVGHNYLDHISELGIEPPERPTIFNKQSSCVVGPGAGIVKPKVSDQLDYEGELGIVVGRRCRKIAQSRAAEVIGGFLVINDVSARDWQKHSPTWTMGKSFDTHGPTGPWVVTADEIGNPHRLDIRTWVNGELRQSSNTRHLLFDCYMLIEYLSAVFTLEPGDIIATGTPGGVGFKMSPPRYIDVGDTVRIEIEDVGVLENSVVPEPGDSAFIQ